MSSKSNKRGLGKSLSDLGLAALLGGDWKKPNPADASSTSGETDGEQPRAVIYPAEAQEHEASSASSSTPAPSVTDSASVPSSAAPAAESGLLQVAIETLQPGRYQPRRHMNDDHLQELAQSIAQQGIIQPIVVRHITTDDSSQVAYEIVAGERRWRAAKIAALHEVPVVVHELTDRDALAIALIENLQREDLNAVDQAIALQRMLNEFDLTHLELAEMVGKSRATISNLLRLLNLHSDVQKLIQQGDLEMGHGRALLALPRELQPEQAEDIISRSLTVRQTEQLIQHKKEDKPTAPNVPALDPELKLQLERMQKRLSQSLDCKVIIQNKVNKKGNGKLTVHYKDQQQLEAMIAKLVEG